MTNYAGQLTREREDLQDRVYLMCKRRRIEPEMALWDARVPNRRMLLHCDTDELKQVRDYLRTQPVVCTENGRTLYWRDLADGRIEAQDGYTGNSGFGATRQEAFDALLELIDEGEVEKK